MVTRKQTMQHYPLQLSKLPRPEKTSKKSQVMFFIAEAMVCIAKSVFLTAEAVFLTAEAVDSTADYRLKTRD